MVDVEKDFSGTTINHCIRSNKPNNITMKSDFNAAVTDSQKVIDNLNDVIITTLGERNAMTESKKIREQIKALLATEIGNIKTTSDALKKNYSSDISGYNTQFDKLKRCMDNVQNCVDSSISDRTSQIKTCPEIKNEDEFGMERLGGQGCFDKIMRDF